MAHPNLLAACPPWCRCGGLPNQFAACAAMPRRCWSRPSWRWRRRGLRARSSATRCLLPSSPSRCVVVQDSVSQPSGTGELVQLISRCSRQPVSKLAATLCWQQASRLAATKALRLCASPQLPTRWCKWQPLQPAFSAIAPKTFTNNLLPSLPAG